MNRREFIVRSLVVGGALTLSPGLSLAAGQNNLPALVAALEEREGGRLGVAYFDLERGHGSGYRSAERFPVCSTFKLLLVAAVLARVDAGQTRLDRRIVFDESALLEWSPVTQLNVGAPGMSVRELCAAAMLMSDNTATNLLLDAVGGPAAVTAFARRLGDTKTRLDHREPLNYRHPGDEDTTTPAAMLDSMEKILLGDVLSTSSRTTLMQWFVFNQTGAQSLRAGLPAGWRVGDKTGSAADANNDIAIVWPPGRQPILIAAYYVNKTADARQRKAVLASVGDMVAATIV